MKRMELNIVITFVIMFIVGVIIKGVYNVTSMQSNFFTFEVMASGLFSALVYLGLVWVHSRKHKFLVCIGTFGICLMLLFILLSSEGVTGFCDDWNWLSTVMCVYTIIAFQIARYQGEVLLEEDEET